MNGQTNCITGEPENGVQVIAAHKKMTLS